MRDQVLSDSTIVDRFHRCYEKKPDGCWQWTGPVSEKGYGITHVRGLRRSIGAHRVSVFLDGRDIPNGHQVDHLCRVPGCVNPAHLEVVLPRENTLRGIGPTAINARKTHCPRGHELVGKDVIVKNGKRSCRVCQRKHELAYQKRKREERKNKEAA